MDNLGRPTGSGNRVLPITDPEQRSLAEHIGAVVMKAGELDASASALAELGMMHEGEFELSAFGKSGEALTSKLKLIEQHVTEAAGFSERYERLHALRNDVVHSFRPVSELNTAQRIIRKTKTEPGGRIEGRIIGIPELIDLWYDMDELRHEMTRLFIEYATRRKPTQPELGVNK